MTAAEYIRWAYFTSWSRRLKPELSPISGGPAWINSERYTIQAKAEEGTSPEAMQGPMLQTLLEDRFKARIRRETRQVAVYVLTVTKGGFKAARFKDGLCRLRDANDLTPIPPPTPGEKPFCGQTLLKDRSNSVIKAEGATLEEFSQLLAFAFNRPVVDRTGLQGRFNLRLEYAPDESTPEFGPNALVPKPDPVGGPSIFTAVQEQLGLKLESSKGPGQLLVIEHIERPSEN